MYIRIYRHVAVVQIKAGNCRPCRRSPPESAQRLRHHSRLFEGALTITMQLYAGLSARKYRQRRLVLGIPFVIPEATVRDLGGTGFSRDAIGESFSVARSVLDNALEHDVRFLKRLG